MGAEVGTRRKPFRPSLHVAARDHHVALGRRFRRSEVVVGMAVHGEGRGFRRALESVLAQRPPVLLGILVLDDVCAEGSRAAAADLLSDPRVAIATALRPHGAAWRARNAIIELAETLCPSIRWHARLDADDVLCGPDAVGSLLDAADDPEVIAVLGGNRQVREGRVLPVPNRATAELLQPAMLLRRLEGMAALEPAAELPSCNLLLRARTGWRYRPERSAEDHWLVAELLLRRTAQVRIVDALYCDYRLDGDVTGSNKATERLADSRRRLLAAAREWAR